MKPLELAQELHQKNIAEKRLAQDKAAKLRKNQDAREKRAAYQFVYWLNSIGLSIEIEDITRIEESKPFSNYFSFWINLHTSKPTTLIAHVTRTDADAGVFEPDEWVGWHDYTETGRTFKSASYGDMESLYEAIYWAVKDQFEKEQS